MMTALQNRRLWALAALLGLAFLGLGFRLVELQVLRHEPLAEQAHDNTQRTYYFQPRRGDIRDVRGRLLATSVPVKTVCADPVMIRNEDGDCQAEVAHALAPLLEVSETELVKRIQLRPVLNEQGQAVCERMLRVQPLERGDRLPRDVPPEQLAHLQNAIRLETTSSHLGLQRLGKLDLAAGVDVEIKV